MELNNILSELFDEFITSLVNNGTIDALRSNMVISDVNQKIIRDIANKNEPLTDSDVVIAMHIMGPLERDNATMNPFDSNDDDWTSDMIDDYAEHLRNYLYTYKESATDIDPSIDPNEMHKGPMAQDIEKVAPDCVKETSDGTKVVDGNRLALVNAGAIGELSRRILAIEERMNGGRI